MSMNCVLALGDNREGIIELRLRRRQISQESGKEAAAKEALGACAESKALIPPGPCRAPPAGQSAPCNACHGVDVKERGAE